MVWIGPENHGELKMKCPKCMESGQVSKVYLGSAVTTCAWNAPYYDEEGAFHNHDSNETKTYYECSNGHEWWEREPRKECPTCGKWWEVEDVATD